MKNEKTLLTLTALASVCLLTGCVQTAEIDTSNTQSSTSGNITTTYSKDNTIAIVQFQVEDTTSSYESLVESGPKKAAIISDMKEDGYDLVTVSEFGRYYTNVSMYFEKGE